MIAFAQQRSRVLEPLVIAGLGQHGGKHRPPFAVGVDVPDPASLAGETLDHLSDRERDQLTVGQLGSASPARARRHHMVINKHVECRQEGVQFFRHTLILNTLHPHGDTDPPHMIFTESLI